MTDRFKPLSGTIGPLFAQLEQRVAAHAELTERIRSALAGPEKDHVVSASCQDDTLVVLADSAAWCPQIRYAQAQLLELLNGSGENKVTKLKVRVGRRPQGLSQA
ncbi:DciA family protein [Steroidobacter flavus]|uniref:DciA family protein n=1 Tax=Steroidobacter flavus TaxID=1842136 RepID=A0ABV8SXR5_9GAMM